MDFATVSFYTVSWMPSSCYKVSSQDHKKEPLTLLESKASGENSLCSQHLHCGRLQAMAPPLLQKSALGCNSKGPTKSPSLAKLQSSYSNKVSKCGRKFTGWYTTAKSSVKLLGMTKNEGTQRLKHLSEVARRKGRTLAPEKLHQLSACKYLQNSTQPSEIDCVHLRQ